MYTTNTIKPLEAKLGGVSYKGLVCVNKVIADNVKRNYLAINRLIFQGVPEEQLLNGRRHGNLGHGRRGGRGTREPRWWRQVE